MDERRAVWLVVDLKVVDAALREGPGGTHLGGEAEEMRGEKEEIWFFRKVR